MSVNWVDRHYADSPARREEHSFPRRREGAADTASTRQRGRSPHESAAPGAGRPLPAEIAFLASHGVPLVLLQYGAALARRQGASADAVLIAERLVSEETFYRALAAELRVAYLATPDGVEPSIDLSGDAARGYARLLRDPHGLRWMFAPRGAGIAQLVGVTRSARGRPLFAITTPRLFDDALRRASARRLASEAAYAVERVYPELAARPALPRNTLAETLLAAFVLVAALVSPIREVSCVTGVFFAAMFLMTIFLRLSACAASFSEAEIAPELDDKDLPIYSVVVALYREASVARQLSDAIDSLDYPALGSKRT